MIDFDAFIRISNEWYYDIELRRARYMRVILRREL